MNTKVLITKDILAKAYLPVYGNHYWSTPNIDELASKGTVFNRHYTVAPSTAMSFLSMVTGKYPYQFDRKEYKYEEEYIGVTLFDKLKNQNIESHIIWSNNYMKFALPYANCFRNAEIHTIDMNQPVGPHLSNYGLLTNDEAKAQKTMEELFKLIDTIPAENSFLWIHLPHVILGRTCYGSDMDLLDSIVAYIRNRFGDNNIYISADHGNMNGVKNKFVYGFHLYEPNICIPLITPRINNEKEIDFPTSNTQLNEIILNNTISKREYVVSETTYYLQANRKSAVIMDNYKYIFDKLSKKEELYDVLWDPNENRNLLEALSWDDNRNRYYNSNEVYFYPYSDNAKAALEKIKTYFTEYWRSGSKKEEFISWFKYMFTKTINSRLNNLKVARKRNRK